MKSFRTIRFLAGVLLAGLVAFSPDAAVAATPAKVVVRFDANGGTGTMAEQVFRRGVAQKLRVNAFKRKGGVFVGWAKLRNGAVAYKNRQKVKNLQTPGGTLVLYARWAKSTYKVRFMPNGGKGKMALESFKYGKAKKLSKNRFKRSGYVFRGWSNRPNGKVLFPDGKKVKNLTKTGQTVRLYAIWTKGRYKVRFNANGGRGTMSDQSFAVGTRKALRANAFTRTGYTFAGWAKSARGAVVYSNRATVRNLASAGGTVTLYAVWRANTPSAGNGLTIRYFDISSDGYSTWTQSEAAMTAYFANRTPTIVANTLSWGDKLNPGFQHVSYDLYPFSIFTGWNRVDQYSDCGFHGKYARQSQDYFAAEIDGYIHIDRSGSYSFAALADDRLVLYIDGQRVCSSYWADYSTGTISLSAGIHHFHAAFYEGYGEQGLIIQWKKPGDSSYSPIPQSVLSRTRSDSSGANKYTVRFNANGGSGSMSDQGFTNNVAQALRANAFTRTGYTFAGWATSASSPVVYMNRQSVSNLASANGAVVTLYATWRANSYTVRFNANGGSGSMADQGFTYNVAQNLRDNAFTRTGHTFAGWATSSNGSVVYKNRQSVSNLAVNNDVVVTLFAVWRANTYKVRFNANGGSGSMVDQEFNYNVAQALHGNSFTRKGSFFVGWATSANGPVAYSNRSLVSNLATANDATVMLYAVWRVLSFSTGGNANWTQTSVDDGAVVQFRDEEGISRSVPLESRWVSSTLSNGQSTWLETTVDGPGTVSFLWSRARYSRFEDFFLAFFVDGNEVCYLDGGGCTRETVSVTGSGSHTLLWEYSKDSSSYSGEECGRVYNIVWTPN